MTEAQPASEPPRSAARRVRQPPAPTRRLRSGDAEQDPGTRQKVVHAAIRCILERGFYRASSNAIADAAGLTWGVIQYYFGSRESLMLAVLDEGNQRLTEILVSADITAEGLEGRLEQFFTVLESYYADADYLAFIQVLLNLSHDPRTSAQTLQSMTEASAAIGDQLDRLTNQVFAGTGVRRAALKNFAFNVLRGMALAEGMLGTLPFDTEVRKKRISHQRRMLAQAVADLIEKEARSSSKAAGRAN
jgi:AcrR family transcriptional regulator